MAQSFFRFKQFTIHQDQCAMKVGTDGVLLGAWVKSDQAKRILDVGTGSGLIALMLAQRTNEAIIDAIEIDAAAVKQAAENAQNSPWSDRIHILHQSLQGYITTKTRYDLIVSNPPFFEEGTKASQQARTIARHNDSLKSEDLWQASQSLLQPNGRLAVIYPVEMAAQFIELGQKFGFKPQRCLNIKPTPYHPIKRKLVEFERQATEYQEETITLEVERHMYTPEFVALIKDFYLKY